MRWPMKMVFLHWIFLCALKVADIYYDTKTYNVGRREPFHILFNR